MEEKTDPQIELPPSFSLPSLGKLDPLVLDPKVTEIMVNDTRSVVFEKEGKLYEAQIHFKSVSEVNQIIAVILRLANKLLSPENPCADCMLPGGMRVHITIPPVSLDGPTLTIRKLPIQSFSLEDLAKSGTLDARMGHFLAQAVAGKLSFVISGGTGSGKTALLNALIHLIPRHERIITIEDTAEIVISHKNSVRLLTQESGSEDGGTGMGIGMGGNRSSRALLAHAMRMRPDRIILGECRKSEALDILQAMNTGHPGSMTTIHANSTRGALSRLETLSMMAGEEIPLRVLRRQITTAVQIVIYLERSADGTRRIASIAELTGMEGENFTLQELFKSEDGQFSATGLIPSFTDRLKKSGIEFRPGTFN